MSETLTRTLKTFGGEIAYTDRGSGPVILFIHGFPLSLRMWDAQEAALVDRYRVVRFDVRGHGASTVGDSILTMDRIADDAAAVIDRLRLGPVILAGFSMGGYAAFAFVRKYASRLRGLVLVDTRATADTAEGRKARAELAERVVREGAKAAVESFMPRLIGETTKKERPDVVAKIRDLILATPPRGIADASHGLAARADSTDTLREIAVPTLILCGDEDVITPVGDAEAMQRGIKGAELVVIPKSGHTAPMETPEAVNSALRTFLGRF